MAYGNAIKKSSIVENWLFQFGFFNGDAQGNGDGGFDAVTQADGNPNEIAEAVGGSETDIDVDDGTVFTAGDHIKIDNEIMKISSISTNTLTVVKGAMGTTSTTHLNNAQIYWQNYIPMALSDVTEQGVFHHGVVLNKVSIRESIDLSTSTAKTSNISVTIPDFEYQGSAVSKELFGGTHKYINQEVRVLSKIDDDDATQIGSFRLTRITTDGEKINLSLTSHRPWDFITIPQAKTDKNNYFPVAYGNFVPNASTRASQQFCGSVALYPCRVEQRSSSYIKGLQPQALDGSSGEEARLHIYEKEVGAFVPLTKSDNTYRDTATADGDGYSTVIEHSLFRGFITKGFIEQGASSNEFGAPANAVVTQNTAVTSTTAANATATSGAEPVSGGYSDRKDLYLDCPSIIGTVTEGKSVFYVQRTTAVLSGSPTGTAEIQDLSGSSIFDRHTYNTESEGTDSATLTSEVTLTLSNGQLPTNYGLFMDLNIISGTYVGASITLDVFDARLKIKANLDFANNKEASISVINGIDYLYCGADGLPESWSGSNAAITEIQEAHRDLLIRFGGMVTTTPTGYSDLDTARSGWTLRWWTDEEVELKRVLDRMAYEGGFIFRFKQGDISQPQYIHIANSPTTDIVLSKHDIANINISHTPFSELITKRKISYEKHPAENRYVSTLTTEDTTNNPRTKWNIQAKENIEEVKLDMLVGNVGDTNMGNDDPNDSFAGYYNNIFGDIKLMVKCSIVNPAKWVDSSLDPIEVGDIIEFDENNMHPETPLGHNSATWDGLKMMIVSTSRSVGKLSIVAREV